MLQLIVYLVAATSAPSTVGSFVAAAFLGGSRTASAVVEKPAMAPFPGTRPVLFEVHNHLAVRLPTDLTGVTIVATNSAVPATIQAYMNGGGVGVSWQILRDARVLAEPSNSESATAKELALHVIDGQENVDDVLQMPEGVRRIVYLLPQTARPRELLVIITAGKATYRFLVLRTDASGRIFTDLRRNIISQQPREFPCVRDGLKAAGLSAVDADAHIAICQKELLRLTDEQILREVLTADTDRLRKSDDVDTVVRLGVLLEVDPWPETTKQVFRYQFAGESVYIAQTGAVNGTTKYRAAGFGEKGNCLWNAMLTVPAQNAETGPYLDDFIRMVEP